MLIDDHNDGVWQNQSGAAPDGGDLSKSGPVLLGEAAQVDQDLLHLLG